MAKKKVPVKERRPASRGKTKAMETPRAEAMVEAKDADPRETHRRKCCCHPCGSVSVSTKSGGIFVENKVTKSSKFEASAAIAQTHSQQPPMSIQDSAADSDLEVTTTKEQGKVYRTDTYTIEWKAEGQCRPLAVSMRVSGAVNHDTHCLAEQGRISLSRNYLLEPPLYEPTGPDFVSVELTVTDCAGESDSCRTRVERP